MANLAVAEKSTFVVGGIGSDTSATDNTFNYYNSAMIFGADGAHVGRYDKIHLVPFGEYIPFKNLLTFAHKLTGKVSDFSRGREHTVFRLVAILVVVHLGLVTLLLGPAQIHAEEHFGPVLALGAAGAGMNGNDGIERVGLAGEHGARFEFLAEGSQRLDIALQVDDHVFAFACQLEVGFDVAGAAHQFLVVGHQRLEALAIAHQRLRGGGIVPHRRIGKLLFNVG